MQNIQPRSYSPLPLSDGEDEIQELQTTLPSVRLTSENATYELPREAESLARVFEVIATTFHEEKKEALKNNCLICVAPSALCIAAGIIKKVTACWITGGTCLGLDVLIGGKLLYENRKRTETSYWASKGLRAYSRPNSRFANYLRRERISEISLERFIEVYRELYESRVRDSNEILEQGDV